ncbi:hypothetical protein [uncultured Thiodictyon sp.]|jgi:hypothetical protein|uniref:hypothetical protein n=1 Tax=uncultured Thiodictyon sp. TaxID=1846217 RepID=UPI0025D8CB92|nr:hypothetical protein [uncultured Thiodictyon sp.]
MRVKPEQAAEQHIKSLWGELPMASPVLAPIEILKQQGALLAKATNGLLTAATTVSGNPLLRDPLNPGDEFRVIMYLVATALNNYRFQVLEVSHGVELYPAVVMAEEKSIKCANQEAFEEAIASILQSARVRGAIGGLLAQMRSH